MTTSMIAPPESRIHLWDPDEAVPAEGTRFAPQGELARGDPARDLPARGDPPRGLLRWLFEIPAVIYRSRMGWIFGRRFLLLTHRGRRSGTIRKTVVEAALFDPETFESLVIAGWGDRTNWYRNIVAGPALEVETGGRRYRPTQRILAPTEVRDAVEEYVERNPWARGVIERLGLATNDGDLREIRVAQLRGVAFRPDPALEPRVRRARRRWTTRRVYDVLAPWYDLAVENLEARVRAAGLRLLDAWPGETIVEFGSGTGQALSALAPLVGVEGRVIGVDLSPAMVERSRTMIAADGIGAWVSAEVGDATGSGLPDDLADGIFMSFVLESFADEDVGRVLAECHRILRPGGRLVVVALDRPDRPGAVVRIYELVHRLFPQIVDCAPMRVVTALRDAAFEVEAVDAQTMTGLPVAVVRARRASA